MPIHNVSAPADGRNALLAGLRRFFPRGTLDPIVPGVALSRLGVTEPHALYEATGDDFRRGGLLAGAQHIGVRHLLTVDGRAVASAEIAVAGAPPASRLSRVESGPFVQRTVDGVLAAEAMPEVAASPYELRFLRCRPRAFVALWLHGPDDILVPLSDHPGLPRLAPATEHAVVAAVQASGDTGCAIVT